MSQTLLNVSINGVKTKVKPGRVIQGIRGAGIPLPSMCYHPDVKSSGGRCRVCMCTVDGKMITPCNADLKEGMNIVTDTPDLISLRQAALDMVPKEGGEDSPLFADTIPLKTTSKYIRRRPELCTNCNLCVQTCQDIQGVSAIGSVRHNDHRGVQNSIRSFHNVTLPESECISCGQCINVCPTGALTEVSEIELVEAALQDSTKTKVFQFAPAVRVALAEEFGCAPGTRSLTHEMVTATRMLGKQIKVFDTNFTADLTIMEEGFELLERLRRNLTGKKKFGDDHMEIALPMITSCSPGWINFCERNYADLLPNLSSCKSPMEMAGALTKHFYPKVLGVQPKDIVSIAVMPCVAKKTEKDRDTFEDEDQGLKDVDNVLTTREFAKLLKKNGIDPTQLQKQDFDDPFGIASGAGLIFGATGGVMEAAIRTAYEVVTGRSVPFSRLAVTPVRGMEGVKEASLKLEHCLPDWSFLEGVELKVVVAHGTMNARKLMDRIRERKAHGEPMPYHFIEIMACPGGCLGGGGQPKPTSWEIKTQRAQLIYKEDENLPLRKSHENPAVQKLYKDFLHEPLGHLSHHLLHTKYKPVEVESHSLLNSEEAQAVLKFLKERGYPTLTRRNLTNMFADIVDKFGCVSDAAMVALAEHTGTTPIDIEAILSHYHFFPRSADNDGTAVYLCDCSNCNLKGSKKIAEDLKSQHIEFHKTSWLGWCVNGAPAALVRHRGDSDVHPLLNIKPQGDDRWKTIQSFKNQGLVINFDVKTMKRFAIAQDGTVKPYLSVLENIDLTPEDAAFLKEKKQCPVSRKVWDMAPEDIISQLKCATLRGCGGAGFQTHFKWSSVRSQPATGPKYVVINADEGLPNTFKDYYLLVNPATRMRMINGMATGAHTVGATHCLLYLRYEYRNLVKPIYESFERYKTLNPNFPKDIKFEVVIGGGPYVCGEETALFESVEGHYPQARSTRTIYPTIHGIFGQPTLVGNVETFAWIPTILYNGGNRFADEAAGHKDGVKLFSLSGAVKKPTLAEYPLGTSLKDVLEECSGLNLADIAAVEVGGILEVMTFPEDFHKPLTLEQTNGQSSLPAGGSIVVYAKDAFDVASVYEAKARFSNAESCQLCTPCRKGSLVFRNRVHDILGNTLAETEKFKMRDLFRAMEMSSNCGHGKQCGKLARVLMDQYSAPPAHAVTK
eukprot:PhF_6_TR8318/c1_g1_i1/m.12925